MINVSLGKVLILGDSYSTFEGFIPPEYGSYYCSAGNPETDVNQVEQTWWYQVMKKTNSDLVLNNSYSGTAICNTGYSGPNDPYSFIRRFDKLVGTGFFVDNKIDTVLIMGGQNDDWSGSPVGEMKIQNWTDEDLLQYGLALCYLMHRLKTVLPNARILFVINSDMKAEIMDYQEKASDVYDVEFIRLHAIHKMNGHPTIKGMNQIAEQIIQYLSKFNRI